MTEGPISVTTFTPSSEEPKDGEYRSQRLEITLTIPFDIGSMTKLPELDRQFLQLWIARDNWDDGRYAYSKELLMDGLQRTISSAVNVMIEKHFRSIHGNEMTKTSETSSTSTAILKASEVLKDVSVFVRGEPWAASITDFQDEV